MEIASGKRSEGNLPEWISELHVAGKITNAADGRLQGDYDKDQMERLLKVGLLCTHHSASERPNVGEVIELLKPGTPFPEESSSFPAEEDDDLSENLDDHSLLQMHTSQSDNRRSLELEASDQRMLILETLEPRHNTL
ncbi:putative kinase [Corchorus olitorius]|uniref:Kinase n=1 Tax=Corchorus olitorius TaxID=93759 RepID=A0A1R3HE99_9ROSI|nr:putative kinase [Corchorus olitorius]